GLTFPSSETQEGRGFHHQETPAETCGREPARRGDMRAPRRARRLLTGFFVVSALALATAAPSLAAPASADLSITKTTASASVAPGAAITYSIAVHNAGPDDAASVQMTDALPAHTVFLSIKAPAV